MARRRKIPVRSRVWRILRHLSDFTMHGDGEELVLPRDILRQGEELLGIYWNHPGSWREAIIVTNRGLHLLRRKGATVLDYSDMERSRRVGEKTQIQSLDIPLRGGQIVRLPVLGHHGRTRDSLSFMRFLDRVFEDLADEKQ